MGLIKTVILVSSRKKFPIEESFLQIHQLHFHMRGSQRIERALISCSPQSISKTVTLTKVNWQAQM